MRLALLTAVSALTILAAGNPPSFHVEVKGKGAPMILIPGLSSSPEVWKETVERYQDRYECHLVTLAGFMGKPAIPEPFLDTVARDLIDYIRTKKLQKPVLLGHSLGGFLAVRIASKEPGLPGKLVIVDALPYLGAAANESITPEEAKAMAASMRRQFLSAPADNGDTWVRGMATRSEDGDRLVSWTKQSAPEAVAAAMVEMWTTDLRADLAKIQSPALVLGTWIAYKQYATKAQVESNFAKQYAALKGVRIKVFDTARHFIMWDDPQGFFAETDRFLSVK